MQFEIRFNEDRFERSGHLLKFPESMIVEGTQEQARNLVTYLNDEFIGYDWVYYLVGGEEDEEGRETSFEKNG